MEFIEFLDRTEVEIIKMVEKAGYKTAENTKLCSLSENYVGFFNKKKRKLSFVQVTQRKERDIPI
tara:strand:- start:200 stop:394 length:195 start_codon:yes stop_codon:yes gene_type:complete